jgi:hypothetical protein
MAGHSRPKDGVASLAYVPAIHAFRISKQGVDARHKAGHDVERMSFERNRASYTALSQPKWIGKPSPDNSAAVSYNGKPTILV